jgi:hypothetical protein
MMKKRIGILISCMLYLGFVSAGCTLTPILLNQDPINAVPGEQVKVVFQIQGVEDAACDEVIFEVMPSYPFSLEPGYASSVSIRGGTLVRSFNSFLMAPYRFLVDAAAIDGEYALKTKITTKGETPLQQINEFNISVNDVGTDFIVTLDSYSFATGKLSLGLLNIGDEDAKAVTLEIPQQPTISVQGGHTKIIGDLDAAEDTTVSFDATLIEGTIAITLSYNDQNGFRHTQNKEVLFSEQPFLNTQVQNKTISTGWVVAGIMGIIFVGYWFISHRRNHLRRQ